MSISKVLCACAILAPLTTLHAEEFSIVDGSATVVGKPSYSPAQAQENWVTACDKWKADTAELNKIDHMMMISCEKSECTPENSQFTCSSKGIFKVKTTGTQVNATPSPAPIQTVASETVISETPPPPVIVETVPAPRPGFIWIGGYWGWRNSRHYWVPGHWETHRPGYVFVSPRWVAHGSRWRFESGYWRH